MRTHHEDTAAEIYGAFRWRTFGPSDLSITDGTADEAAEAIGIGVTEIEWAIEEYGRCDTESIVVWKPGPIEYGTDEEPIQGGYEWPATESPGEYR
jgi:hypothetical protein